MTFKTSFSSNIQFNGKNVEVKDLPESVRKLVEDKNANGMPDGVEQLIEKAQEQKTSHEITINGKTYNSWDEVPENERAKWQQLEKQFQKMGKMMAENSEKEDEAGKSPVIESPVKETLPQTMETSLSAKSGAQKILNIALIVCLVTMVIMLLFKLGLLR